MSEPPRRRRSAPPPRRATRGPGVFPTIALGIGVVVAGLGIGAFLSALQRTNGPTTYATPAGGLPVVTPLAHATRGPVVMAPIVSHAKPSPSPSPTSSPSPNPSASASASPTPAASATAKPSATPTPKHSPKPSAAPRSTATPRAPTFPPVAVPRLTAGPIVPTSAPAVPVVRSSAPPAPPHPFAAQAESTVRRYLDALIAGNESGAYSAFGAAPGDPNVRLLEEGFIDRGTRIVSLRTTHADAAGATVEAELASSRGSYLATYHLSGGPSGAVIDSHDYIRE